MNRHQNYFHISHQHMKHQGGPTSFLIKILTGIPRWIFTNKFKTILLIIVIYLFRTAWRWYQTYIKPYLPMIYALMGWSKPGDNKPKSVKDVK